MWGVTTRLNALGAHGSVYLNTGNEPQRHRGHRVRAHRGLGGRRRRAPRLGGLEGAGGQRRAVPQLRAQRHNPSVPLRLCVWPLWFVRPTRRRALPPPLPAGAHARPLPQATRLAQPSPQILLATTPPRPAPAQHLPRATPPTKAARTSPAPPSGDPAPTIVASPSPRVGGAPTFVDLSPPPVAASTTTLTPPPPRGPRQTARRRPLAHPVAGAAQQT